LERDADRIMTTHAGSLARPSKLVSLIQAKQKGQPYDHDAFEEQSQAAVEEVVQKQSAAGIDIIGDGEQSKSSFRKYFSERASGFKELDEVDSAGEYATSREWQAFPEYYRDEVKYAHRNVITLTCTGPLEYTGHAELQADIDHLKAAAATVGHEDAFMTAISPTYGAAITPNQYYATHEEYEQAWVEVVREEYKAIVAAGLILQIDDPRWITYYTLHPEMSVQDWRRWAQQRVEVINYALRGIPAERVRFHTCYSINIGPRIYELELKDIVDLMLDINVGAYNFEAANPRHEHEYHVWEQVKLPEGKKLIPGMISHTTNLVEHPQLIADRILRYANLVGRENVIAGADCGFSTNAKDEYEIHPTVVWPKLTALAEGAQLASNQLWGRT
jgi:5-methyltetrahydropteroyltriglutamate--homocysteine methyltransferase